MKETTSVSVIPSFFSNSCDLWNRVSNLFSLFMVESDVPMCYHHPSERYHNFFWIGKQNLGRLTSTICCTLGIASHLILSSCASSISFTISIIDRNEVIVYCYFILYLSLPHTVTSCNVAKTHSHSLVVLAR